MDVSVSKTGSTPGVYVAASAPKGGGQAFSQAFQQQMDEQERGEYRERVEILFEELHGSARNLLRQGDLTEFETYRNKISELMDEILHHAYLFQPERVRDGFGRQRIFATIQVVDEKMERLGKDLLSENREQLDFLSRIDEVRGLIMDLFS
jgi:Uncharacterized protein conserved in bacteria